MSFQEEMKFLFLKLLIPHYSGGIIIIKTKYLNPVALIQTAIISKTFQKGSHSYGVFLSNMWKYVLLS